MNSKSLPDSIFFNEIVFSNLNRRSFIQRAALAAGTTFLWNSCAWSPSKRDREILIKINDIKNKEPSEPEDIQALKDILLTWSGRHSTEITIEGSQALALQSDFFVVPTFKEIFLRNIRNRKFIKSFIPLLALNYAVNPPGRLKIIYFLYVLSLKVERRRGLNLTNSEIEQATSAFRFLGNIALRNYLIKLNIAMTVAHKDKSVIDYQHELQNLIGEINPQFLNVDLENINAERFPDKNKIDLWKAQLAKGSDKEKIYSLLKLHRHSFLHFEPLLDMLKNVSLNVKKAAVPILGNNLALNNKAISTMLNYLDSNDDELSIAAAKAIRFKENLPAKDIVEILKFRRKKDPLLGKKIDNILLSSLVSEDSALQDVFIALVHNLFNTEPSNLKDTITQINEMRIWYWRLSNNRLGENSYPYYIDEIGALDIKDNFLYERNDRNKRAKLAMNMVPENIQKLFISFLRQIPDIVPPSDNYNNERLSRDLNDLQEIYSELFDRQKIILFDMDDKIWKGSKIES